MNREIVLERLNTIKQMPGLDKSREEGPEQVAIYNELDNFLQLCIDEVPEDYDVTDEDRQAVTAMLNDTERSPADYIGDAPPVVQGSAAVRLALTTYQLPINGIRCKNWKPFVERYKRAIADA
jgi:hypothetical protein